MNEEEYKALTALGIFAAIGAVTGMFKSLGTSPRPTWSQLASKVGLTTILAMGAGATGLFFNIEGDVPLIGLIGVSALLATFGEEFVAEVIRNRFKKGK